MSTHFFSLGRYYISAKRKGLNSDESLVGSFIYYFIAQYKDMQYVPTDTIHYLVKPKQ